MTQPSSFTHSNSYRIGFVGLGKLGLPCALGMNLKGHDVMGYDLRPECMQKSTFPFIEKGPQGEDSIEPLLQQSSLKFGSLSQVVQHSEILFVAVQTPHDAKYEGITRLPAERLDFDYRPLTQVMKNISYELDQLQIPKTVVIISTVLPGTIRREICPLLSPWIRLCYNPYFIAMGQVLKDLYHPEFVLFGVVDPEAAEMARHFYTTLHQAPFFQTSLENAELIKVAYNTMISMKLSFVNTLMEICHHSPGTNIDQVTEALKLGHQRLISPAYLTAGMGDGGGCHPRDNIALSALSRKLNLKFDFFETLMMQREKQADFFASLIESEHLKAPHLPIQIFGVAYKPQSSLITGSHALLLLNILQEHGHQFQVWDPYVHEYSSVKLKMEPALIFLGQKHHEFMNYSFSPGSVVIDPHRCLKKNDYPDITIISVGAL